MIVGVGVLVGVSVGVGVIAVYLELYCVYPEETSPLLNALSYICTT